MTEAEFQQCINKIVQGDKTGLKEIYEEYLPYLYRTVYSIVQNREDAEDVTSEFFIKLWTLAARYQPGNGRKGYLATIARNMAIDHVRKRGREIPVQEPERHLYGNSSETFGAEEDAAPQTAGDPGDPQDGERRVRAGTSPGDMAAPEMSTPEEQVIEDISIREALDRLKPEERQIIDLKVLGEMTFKEISELLGIPMGTVTWRYQEGIKRLRRFGYE